MLFEKCSYYIYLVFSAFSLVSHDMKSNVFYAFSLIFGTKKSFLKTISKQANDALKV